MSMVATVIVPVLLIGSLALPPSAQSAPEDRRVTVMLKLADDPVAVVRGRAPGRRLSKEEEKTLADSLRRKQDTLVPAIEALGGKVLSKVQFAMNAIKVLAPADRLDALSRLPGIVGVIRVPNSVPTGGRR